MKGQAGLPVEQVIRRLSNHLDGLAAEVHAIEFAIGEELEIGSAVNDRYIKRLQRLDFLRQSLEDLALLNLYLADQTSGSLDGSQIPRLHLASTRLLLEQTPTDLPVAVSTSCLGDVDLF